MNKRKIGQFLIGGLLLLLINCSSVRAAGFQLTRIGGLQIKGANYSEWWYSSENPSLGGIAPANSSVTVTIDDQSGSVNADADGNWSYQPTNLTFGDHQVTISGEGNSLSFTLHITKDIPSNISAPSESELPVVGIIDRTIALLSGGIFLLFLSFFLSQIKINFFHLFKN